MADVPPTFFINYCEIETLVSVEVRKTGRHFIIHLASGKVRLKSEGLKTKIWIEKGKGATSLALTLGHLIENALSTGLTYRNICGNNLTE